MGVGEAELAPFSAPPLLEADALFAPYLASDLNPLGAAGHCRRGFNRRSLRADESFDGLFYLSRHVLDSARYLFPALHATGRARSAGECRADGCES